MAELRRVAAVPRVRAFLQEMSDQLHSEIEHRVDPIVAARHLTTGLPIASWADGSSTPSFTYLSSLPVTLVLTFVVQLAAYHYSAEYTELPAGAVGHSQGQAAALAISLASVAASGSNVPFAFARVLLHLGVAIAEAVRLRHGDAEASTEGLAATSFALAVLKIPVAEVSRLAASFYDVQPPCRRSKSGSGEGGEGGGGEGGGGEGGGDGGGGDGGGGDGGGNGGGDGGGGDGGGVDGGGAGGIQIKF
jgi:uncharacterized membrane protein YgcG